MKAIGGEIGEFMVPTGAQQNQEGDPGDPFSSGKKPGMIGVGNKNLVQVRRPLAVLKKPLGVAKSPVAVKKVDMPDLEVADAQMAEALGFDGDWQQLRIGIGEEQEHADTVGDDQETIVRIVLDHLKEDPEYYTKLKAAMTKMERVLQKHCGVSAEDDVYFAAPIQIRTDVEMPSQGANDSLIISMGSEELSQRPAVWKPEDGEDAKLQEWVGGKLFCRGEAAYLLDRELAPDENSYLVPVTFTAEIDGVKGSVQHYVTGREAREDVNAYGSEWVERAAVLDYIMGQVDRNRKNWLTHPDDDKRPVLIDSDLSFPVDPAQKLHSSFIDAMNDKLLSAKTLDMIYLALGNHDLWDDLREVMDSDESVEHAKERAQKLYDAKKIGMSNPVKVFRGEPILVKDDAGQDDVIIPDELAKVEQPDILPEEIVPEVAKPKRSRNKKAK
jgi:hypothetical protein